MEVPPDNPLRIALYARVSTDEQRDGQTIESQLDELRRFVEQKRWIITAEYRDDGWSGALLERPQLDRLRDDAPRKIFDAVLVNDVDRLARNVTHLGVIKRSLERHGVSVIFRKLPSDNTPTNNLLVNILGSFAEFERELIADRTRRGRRYKVEVRQQFLGSIPPYGYAYISKNRSPSGEGILEVIQSEAALVRDMYRWVAEDGLSARRVIARLNERKTPARKGGAWQKSSVLRVLRTEMYAGTWYYNKHELRHHEADSGIDHRGSRARTTLHLRPRSAWLPVVLPEHLRIIDRGVWDRVQRQLDQNFAFSKRNSKHDYLLRGLVRCGACSGPYVGEPNSGRFYYRCLSRCHRLPMITEDRLNEAVWLAVVAVLRNPNEIARRIEAVLRRRRTSDAGAAAETRTRDAALARLGAEEDRVIQAYRAQILSPELLGRELEKIRAQRSALQMRDNDLAAANADVPITAARVSEALELAARRLPAMTFDERQRIIRLLVRSVRFEGSRATLIGRVPKQDELDEPADPPTDPVGSPALDPEPTEPALALDSLSCRIVSTEVGPRGRNPTVEFEVIAQIPPFTPHQPRDDKTGRFVTFGNSPGVADERPAA